MKSHWSTTNIADKLRGTKKPDSGTVTAWKNWENTAKTAHPVRYWLVEEVLPIIQDVWTYIPSKLNAISYYINNRWITRTNSLTANKQDIKPGQWSDVGDRILYCLFNELQDFVEIEVAWMHIACSNKESIAKYNIPAYAISRFSRRAFRCPQAGLDNLKWQSELIQRAEEGYTGNDLGKPAIQAIRAQEILSLYTWWTDTYRNRPDPGALSGWESSTRTADDTVESFLESLENHDTDSEISKARYESLDRMHKIEADYKEEETNMLIRLIKIRDSLWT